MTKVEFPTQNPWTLAQMAAEPGGAPLAAGWPAVWRTTADVGAKKSQLPALNGSWLPTH